MYVTFGSYRHPSNECNLTSFESITRYSERNRRMTTKQRMHISGELIYTGQAALAPRIAELIDAYAIEDQTLCLWHDDGTQTRHRLESSAQNANNISGVKIAYRSWPKGEPEEYATARTFYIIAEATYRDLDGELIDYHDRVRIRGTTGPRRRFMEFATGPARAQITNQSTLQEIVQEGYAVGFDGWPLGFVPGPIWPTNELVDERVIDHAAPSYAGAAFTHYRTNWRYVMVHNTNVGGFPVII